MNIMNEIRGQAVIALMFILLKLKQYAAKIP